MKRTLPKGHASCLSDAFRYTDAVHTDIAKTFARIRNQVKQGQTQERDTNVRALPARKHGQS